MEYGDTVHVYHNKAVSFARDFEATKNLQTQNIIKCSITSEGQKTFHDMPTGTMLFMSDVGELFWSKAGKGDLVPYEPPEAGSRG
jgi:hypothetical protein